MRIGIAGINGRVGVLLAEQALASGETLAGGTARSGSPSGTDVSVFTTVGPLAELSDVVIDFTHADTVFAHAKALAAAGCAWVIGTTGLTPDAQQAVVTASATIPIVQAANFSPGVTLITRIARQMAQSLPADGYDAEIVEMHHRQKVDAPSGTALAIGQAVADGRGVTLADVRESGRDGRTGVRETGAIGFASLRGGQIVGEHTLLFTSADEQIALTHRAFDRRVFAAGAVRAACWLHGRPPGLYSMEDVLGLD